MEGATSLRLLGEAADITAGSVALNKQLFELIRSMVEARQIEFDQLIWKKGSVAGPEWIHISFRAGANRVLRRFLFFRWGKKTVRLEVVNKILYTTVHQRSAYNSTSQEAS